MRTVFHVGHSKTGSTAIQATLHASREALLARGVLYPANPNGLYENHRLLVGDLFRPEQVPRHIRKNYAPDALSGARDALVASIRAEIAEHRPDCLLMSSESRFGAWTTAQRRGFADTLEAVGGRDPEIVAYVRRPSGWYLSALQQGFRASHVVKPPRMLQIASPIEQFASDFGRDHLALRAFDRATLVGGDVVADFVATVLGPHGVVAAALTQGTAENRSLSAESFDLVRRWRAAFHPAEADRFVPAGHRLHGALAAIEEEVRPPRPSMDPDLAERIDYCRDDLLRLRDDHGLVLPDYDYGRMERGEFRKLPQHVPPLDRIVVIDRTVQAEVLERLRGTRWAREEDERLAWLAALPAEIEGEARPGARILRTAGPVMRTAGQDEALPALWEPAPLARGASVATLGGPFAERLGPALRRAGLRWAEAEAPPAGLPSARARRLGYGLASARTGPIPTATVLARWLRWAASGETPSHGLREEDGRVLDGLRPGVERDGFATAEEALASRRVTVEALARAVRGAGALVVEIGTARAWIDGEGAELPSPMPGAPEPRLVSQGVSEVLGALRDVRAAVAALDPACRLVLCVVPRAPAAPPRPAGAVAAPRDGAALRAAAGEAARWEGVEYLPAFEALAARVEMSGADGPMVPDAALDLLAEAAAALLAEAEIPPVAAGGRA